ncbi:MAG: aminotransferase class IV [Flavisolibacter sp.]
MNICFNGKYLPSSLPVITAQNHSFKWGDGLFETMKLLNGEILLQDLHFDRLFHGLEMLQINCDTSFAQEIISKQIISLAQQNDCSNLARVRLAVYRNEQNRAEFVIEAKPLSQDYNRWDDHGWAMGIYPHVRKQTDAISNLKSSSYLAYVLAGRYAKENDMDEAIVLNTSNFICDGSKSNIFLIKANEIITPALHQGCINGVMRKYLIAELKSSGRVIKQQEVSEEDMMNADEIFITNALVGIRWVHSFKEKTFTAQQTQSIYKKYVATFFD